VFQKKNTTMEYSILESVREKIKKLREEDVLTPGEYRKGHALYISGACQILSQGKGYFEVLFSDEREEHVINILFTEDKILSCKRNGKAASWESLELAALLQVAEEIERTKPKVPEEGKVYTREGMMKRVLEERKEKARKANYQIEFADNIYGEHILVSEKGNRYKITLRDFENETGYINNPDLETNKLGTTKHLLFAFRKLRENPELFNRLDKTYPFVEIYLDPLNDYKVTWYYPHELNEEIKNLIDIHFQGNKHLEDDQLINFLPFLEEAADMSGIKVRPEVGEKVRKIFDRHSLEEIRKTYEPDFSLLNATLFPYQQKGVEFATFRQGAIIADEMGLGKTIQAIATAVIKKDIFGFRKTLIVCPASLKEQWKKEIKKFCGEKAVIAEGNPESREEIYRESDAFFVILNYETVLRDLHAINRMEPDFVILDEAQRIKNYTTITAHSIKQIRRKHALVITGTPIENRLIDLYSIVQFIDPHFLAPLWEFSYQHCYFDVEKKNKITGHYNLQGLKERLKEILIRREKQQVIKELPNVTEVLVPVDLHEDQMMYHVSYAKGVAAILRKKFMTPYDHQRLMLLMNNMRMVSDSTYLIDKETYISPKLEELRTVLLDKLDVLNSDSKIVIFSEWVTMLALIGKMLREEGVGFAQLTGQVAVKNRGKLIKKFEEDSNCKVFLSSDAGGTGLNLQMADTVINFELPWNPAKKNQRIGRINRIGQKSENLTVINFIAKKSIETRIASGLSLKESLFESVLNKGSVQDVVDFSSSGKAEFVRQLEEMMEEFSNYEIVEESVMDLTDEEREEQELLQNVEESRPEAEQVAAGNGKSVPSEKERMESMEKVMNQGMEFLAGLYKMSTGKDAEFANRKVEVDRETGEVVMRFKIPEF
jgi:SNF2 family DNA or RNA helicase